LTPGNDSGDISIRDIETGYLYICPRPNDNLKIPNWGVAQARDIVVMDCDGNLLEDNGILPTVEAPMHIHIYRARPEINAIVHSHADWSSVFAITGKNIPLVLAEQSLFLGGEVICAEYGKVGSQEIARNIVKALGKTKYAALMQNHGAVCLGHDLEEAFIVSDFLENGAKKTLFGSLLGGLVIREPDEILDESLL
jgi:L-ribulose-5-phosphate 4-epimerase